MLFPFKDRQDLKDSEELTTFQNQINVVRLQDKLVKQNFHEDMKKVFQPMADAIKNTSQDISKTITEISIKNNKVLENLNEKILDLMNDKGMLAATLASSLVNLFKPENKSQFRIKKTLVQLK